MVMTREMLFGLRMFQGAIDDQTLQMLSKQQLYILKQIIIFEAVYTFSIEHRF